MATVPFSAAQGPLTPATPITLGPFNVVNMTRVDWALTFPAGSWTNPPGGSVQASIERFDLPSGQWVFWSGDTRTQGIFDKNGTTVSGSLICAPMTGQMRIRVAPNANMTLGVQGSVVADSAA